MNLHPITWSILGLALFGLVMAMTLIIPLLCLIAIAWLLSKKTKLAKFNEFEVQNNDRKRVVVVRSDSSSHGKDAKIIAPETSGL